MDGVFVKGLFLCLLVTFSNFSQSSNHQYSAGNVYDGKLLTGEFYKRNPPEASDIAGIAFRRRVHQYNTISGTNNNADRVEAASLYLPYLAVGEAVRWFYSHNKNKLTEIRREILTDNVWINSFKYTYIYDVYGNQTSELFQMWENSAWQNKHLVTYSYPAGQNVMSELLYQEWQEGSWINVLRFLYTFDLTGRDSVRTYQWWANIWATQSRQTYAYDSSGNLITMLTQQLAGNLWRNLMKESFSYDPEGMLQTEQVQQWEENQWFNISLTKTTRYAEEKRFEKQQHRWIDTIWIKTYLDTYGYDQNGRLVNNLYQYWSDGLLVNISKKDYENDENGNPNSVAYFSWVNNSWMQYPGEIELSFQDSKYAFFSDRTHRLAVTYTMVPVGVDDEKINEFDFELLQNYPNPFNPITTIRYTLPETAHLKLTMYAMMGDEQVILVDEVKQQGRHEITFNAENKPSGVYFYRIEYSGKVKVGKMLLLK